MTEPTGGWKGEGYELSPEQNRVVTQRWEQAAAARDRMDAMMKDVQQETAQSHGGKLEGLQYSLKDVESFRRKAATAVQDKKVPVEKTARKVNDLNRYTLTFEPDSYTEGVERTYERLREQGYEPTAEKNTWQDPVYKGVNTTWRHTQSEEKFELQFHTPDGFKAKMENHELYEISRSNDIDELAKGDEELAKSYLDAANHLQNERYKNVKIPPGQERIGEQLIRDKLNPRVPAEHVELIRQKEAEKRAENEAKALAKAEAKKQAEQAALQLDGPEQARSQDLRNKLAATARAEKPRQAVEPPRVEPLRTRSRGRGPSL
ncbi:hypothetical protein IPZ58_00585 [Streptomyces roseoverticillatus]|uniref:hypothetical protein n=1 Tax=Streptomyces roseoverticillatus TaxID=66429 RepID=UPI001F322C94|nr:hypothetical protein [Streptomyces roseoverticillatus]MCF3100087.1 hypothetical protein [Streptomyces roseoverticillatus]